MARWGDTLRLSAEARDANGSVVAGAVISWSSGDDAVATVSSEGLVTATGNGATVVTAAAEGSQGSASVAVSLEQDPDKAALVEVYNATNGASWKNSMNWLTDAPLNEWHGVGTDSDGRVSSLDLYSNGLTGTIPDELGDLTNLQSLSLGNNDLTGPIPAGLVDLSNLKSLNLSDNDLQAEIPSELGSLDSMETLNLSGNDLRGQIPSELASLSKLKSLNLAVNGLTGPIPPELGDASNLNDLLLGFNNLQGSIPYELGNLSSLKTLHLYRNGLTGEIPSELGSLYSLESLYLNDNGLTGKMPSELGSLSVLRRLDLNGNGLAGPMPDEVISLSSLELLYVGDAVCAPRTAVFTTWLNGIARHNVTYCLPPSDQSIAYTMQVVAPRNYSVPLVAGETVLLRVFVTAHNPDSVGIPLVRATFYSGGAAVHTADISAQPNNPIPASVDESDLAGSANAEIPGSVLSPGLEMVVEIDPDSTLDSSVDVVSRIPETGRIGLDVQSVDVFVLTVIPFLLTSNPDSTLLALTDSLGPDHELFDLTRTILPISGMEVTVHGPMWTSSSNTFHLVNLVRATRVPEGGTGYWMGMLRETEDWFIGRAFIGGQDSFSQPNEEIIAHEFGHNLSLWHAPCGGAGGPDPAYPYPNGRIGVWGWDPRANRLVRPGTRDLMGYCSNRWISDYQYSKAFNHRTSTGPVLNSVLLAANQRSLLLWGGADADGNALLNPAFVIDAPPSLPDAGGAYRITGEAENGSVLFSLNFDMQEIADGDGGSGFAFALPVSPSWAGTLNRITLTGGGRSAVLDREGDEAAVLLRDPATGQVRGLLLDVPIDPDAQADRLTPLSAQNMDVQVSRGIPPAGAWQR